MRGTSHIAIGEMARIWREITVRNVVVRELRLRAVPAVGRASMTGGFLSHGEGNYEPGRGDF